MGKGRRNTSAGGSSFISTSTDVLFCTGSVIGFGEGAGAGSATCGGGTVVCSAISGVMEYGN